MRSDPEFHALLRQLLRDGVAPKYVSRLTAELQDHYRDLEHEAHRAGLPPVDVAADARERLGRCSAIAAEFGKHPELLSWIHSSAWLAAALRALSNRCVALCSPIKALSGGPDIVMRYTAAGAAGAALTTLMLLSMVVTLSPDSGAVHAMTDTLRVPFKGFVPRRIDPAPVEAGRRRAMDGATGLRGRGARSADIGSTRGGLRASSGQAEILPGEPAAYAGGRVRHVPAGPEPVYGALLSVEPPRPPLPAASSPSAFVFGVDDLPAARLPMPEEPRTGMDTGADAYDALHPVVDSLPSYPRVAARLGLEGYVVVEYTVSRLGRAEAVTVIESSHELFHRAAVQAARDFRFEPRVVGGEAVDVHGMRTTIRFTLER